MPVWSGPGTAAHASSAAELRYRMNYPLAPSRGVRVVALDSGAEAVVRQVSKSGWNKARFYVAETNLNTQGIQGAPVEVVLHGFDGAVASLNDELEDVDSTIMVATSDFGSEAAATIGAACSVRGIMTAGLVLGEDTENTVSALRPYAQVLLVPADDADLEAILTAMRAK
ncbi:MAG: 3-methyl-2-oxobutanoate hydroxymethyltransferase [Actinomycetota bacterium]|nr:MAG: 3-methyl-2-oxobutanoate hydroxymethyltransferase [Actinomycetota bacterium]